MKTVNTAATAVPLPPNPPLPHASRWPASFFMGMTAAEICMEYCESIDDYLAMKRGATDEETYLVRKYGWR